MSILSELPIGESATLAGLNLPETVQHHLMHMGFVPGAKILALRRAPAGDPTVYLIDGMEIGLRRETASAIHLCLKDGSAPHRVSEGCLEVPELVEVAR